MEKVTSKIVKIEKKGRSKVYDFTVEDVHKILANNFYTSNCSINHPDSEDFIDAKMQEGKITGANVSIKIDDEFMKAVKNSKTYLQKFPIDVETPKFTKEVKANKIWDKIVYNAWKCVPYDTEIPVYDESNVYSIKKIGDIVKNKDRYNVLSLNLENLKIEKKPIIDWQEYKNDKNIFKIKTKKGKESIATEDHIVYILNDEKVKSVPISEVKVGDYLIVSDKNRLDENDNNSDVELNIECFDHCSVVFDDYVGILNRNKEIISDILGCYDKSPKLSQYIYNGSMPISEYLKIKHLIDAENVIITRGDVYIDDKIIFNDVNYDKVVSVDRIDSVDYVYDITVKDNHTFILSNGSILSNSAEPGILFWDTIMKESVPDCYADHGFTTISTNPCIVGDTLIAVADGRNAVSIRQLVEEGNDVPVYSLNNNGKLCIKTMRNPRITGYNQQIYKVTIEGGHELRVTGNHKFRLRNGEYVEAKDLKYGDSLHIMTKSVAAFHDIFEKSNSKSQNYMWLSNSGKKGLIPEHRLLTDEMVDIDPRLVRTYKKALENGYNARINNNEVLVTRLCEECGCEYDVNYFRREISFCSHACSLKYINRNADIKIKRSKFINKNYKNKSEKNKIEQIKIYSDLKFKLKRNPLLKEWENKCKNQNIPYRLGTKYGFNQYLDIKEESENYNHKIISVELDGFEDVYNGTVDDYHNFFSGMFKEKNRFGKDKYLSVNQLQCGEITLCPYDSCRLLAINLYSYVINPFSKDAHFDYDLFKEHVQYAQRFMDDIVDLEIEKIEKIQSKIKTDPEPEHIKRTEIELWEKIMDMAIKGRRTGLGVTAEGDMIAALGLRYGTKEATDFSTKVHKIVAVNSYKSSATMAKERGSFPVYDYDKEVDNPFVNRLKNADKELDDMLKKYGRRNISLLTIAPTGCMVEDTRIKTDNGNITLAQLFLINGYNLEKLRGLNGIWLDVNKDIYVYNSEGKKNKITKLYWNGEVKTKKLKLSKDIEVETSDEHKFLVKLNDREAIWKKVEELSIGDKIIQKIM